MGELDHKWSRGIYSPDIIGSQDHAATRNCPQCGRALKDVPWSCIDGVYICWYCQFGIEPGSIEAAVYFMEPQAIANLKAKEGTQ